MASVDGGTIRGTRCVTKGKAAVQQAPPVREPVRVGSGKYRFQSGVLKEAGILLLISLCEVVNRHDDVIAF